MAISEIDHRAIEAERVRLLQRGMTRQVVDSVLALLDEALRGVLDGRVYVDEAYLDYSRAPWLAESRASRRAALKAAPAPGVRRPGADGARRESHAARPGHRRAGSTSSTASSDPGDCDGPGEAGPRLWLAPRPCRLREAEGRRL